MPRELQRHYISASDSDIETMLKAVGCTGLDQLYDHIPAHCRFSQPPDLPDELSYGDLQERLARIANKNRPRHSFIGDALPHYRTMPVVGPVCAIRNLTTAFTSY